MAGLRGELDETEPQIPQSDALAPGRKREMLGERRQMLGGSGIMPGVEQEQVARALAEDRARQIAVRQPQAFEVLRPGGEPARCAEIGTFRQPFIDPGRIREQMEALIETVEAECVRRSGLARDVAIAFVFVHQRRKTASADPDQGFVTRHAGDAPVQLDGCHGRGAAPGREGVEPHMGAVGCSAQCRAGLGEETGAYEKMNGRLPTGSACV